MELVNTPHVSDFTKKTLAQFGWQEGDPIPADLGPMLVKVRESVPPSPRADVLVDVAVMPPDAIEQARQMLQAAKSCAAQQAEEAQRKAEIAKLNPAAQQLLKMADAMPEPPQIINDLDEASAVKPASAAPETPAGPAPAEPEESMTGLGPMAILPFCPRCGWDMRQKFEIVPTDLDKEDFLAATLGGTKFERTYEIFGGKLKIIFHTILAEENKLIHRQLVLDQEAKRIVTEAEWFVQMLEYRLAFSLAAITDANGKPTSVIPALGALPAVEGESALITLSNYVNNEVLAHEVTRRLVGTHLRQFQRLVEALEAMALEPSFWNGIA